MTDQPNDNSESLLYRGAEIKSQMKQLEAEFEMLQPQIIARVRELSATGQDKYAVAVGEMGTFSIAKYRKWKYSSIVDKLKIKMDEQMNHERADGTAIPEGTDILKFNTKNYPYSMTDKAREMLEEIFTSGSFSSMSETLRYCIQTTHKRQFPYYKVAGEEKKD